MTSTLSTATSTLANVSTREKILDAAERCLERYGIQKTTLADVAEEAGIARVTVYRQFADRDSLFFDTSIHILNRRWQRIAEKLARETDPSAWLLAALMANYDMIRQEASEGRYQQRDFRGDGMAIALSPKGLASISVHLKPLLSRANRNLRKGVNIDDVAEWLHWQSFIIDSQWSQKLQSKKQWQRWLKPQVEAWFVD